MFNPSLYPKISRPGNGYRAALTPPSVAPILDVQTMLGSDDASLTWTPSNKTSSQGFGYDIEVDINGGGWNTIIGTTNLFYTHTVGSAAGETYKYRIKPFNDYGEGPSSNEVEVVLPGEPEGPELTGPVYASDDYTIEWSFIIGATSYDIYKSVDGITFSLLANTPLAFRDITHSFPGMYYYIIAKNAISSSQPSNTLYVNHLLPFDTNGNISGLTGWGEDFVGDDITPYYKIAVNLSWDSYAGATSYLVYRTIGIVTTLIGTTSGTTYRDDTVDYNEGDGPNYYYSVTATNGYDNVGGMLIGPFTPVEPPSPILFGRNLEDGTQKYMENSIERLLEQA